MSAAPASTETMSGAVRRATAKRKRPAVYGRIRVLVDPKTGEEVRGVKFNSASDVEQVRERKFKNGDLVKMTLSKSVDPWVNRAVHALGKLVVANIDSFEGYTSHQALKRLQAESGVHCELLQIDGNLVCKIPNSLNFSDTDDTEFREFARGICRYLVKRYWPTATPEAIEEMAELHSKVESV